MLVLLFDLRDFSTFSDFFDFITDVTFVEGSLSPKWFELADDDEDVVDTDAPEEVETEVRMLFDFFKLTLRRDDEGQRGFSRHSSGLSDEKSARIPLSVNMKKYPC